MSSPRAVTATEAPIDKPPSRRPARCRRSTEMDEFLRPLLAALSSRPELARWLATDDLIRQLAMAIDQAAAGGSPARDFKVLTPQTPFTTAGRATARTIDPASYRRYDGLVQHRHVDRRRRGREDLPPDPAAVERGVQGPRSPERRRRSRHRQRDRHPARDAGREGLRSPWSPTAAAGPTPIRNWKRCCRRRSSCCAWGPRTPSRLSGWLRALQRPRFSPSHQAVDDGVDAERVALG